MTINPCRHCGGDQYMVLGERICPNCNTSSEDTFHKTCRSGMIHIKDCGTPEAPFDDGFYCKCGCTGADEWCLWELIKRGAEEAVKDMVTYGARTDWY